MNERLCTYCVHHCQLESAISTAADNYSLQAIHSNTSYEICPHYHSQQERIMLALRENQGEERVVQGFNNGFHSDPTERKDLVNFSYDDPIEVRKARHDETQRKRLESRRARKALKDGSGTISSTSFTAETAQSEPTISGSEEQPAAQTQLLESLAPNYSHESRQIVPRDPLPKPPKPVSSPQILDQPDRQYLRPEFTLPGPGNTTFNPGMTPSTYPVTGEHKPLSSIEQRPRMYARSASSDQVFRSSDSYNQSSSRDIERKKLKEARELDAIVSRFLNTKYNLPTDQRDLYITQYMVDQEDFADAIQHAGIADQLFELIDRLVEIRSQYPHESVQFTNEQSSVYEKELSQLYADFGIVGEDYQELRDRLEDLLERIIHFN